MLQLPIRLITEPVIGDTTALTGPLVGGDGGGPGGSVTRFTPLIRIRCQANVAKPLGCVAVKARETGVVFLVT
jgi:hypothetical protein